MQNLAAKFSLLALLVAGAAQAAVIDETGAPSMPGAAPGATSAPMGAGADRAMRTAISLNAVQQAFDGSDPRDNIAFFKYDRATIYKLRLREFMSVTVVLPPGEKVDAYNLGDDTNFTFIPYAGSSDKKGGSKADKKGGADRLDNVFSIRPTYPGADTSLTVIGRSGRFYSFYMRVDSVKSAHMPIFTAFIEDKAAGLIPLDKSAPAEEGENPAAVDLLSAPEKMTGEDAAAEAEYLRSLPLVDPSKININGYKIAGGDKALAPVKVFDDGYWTYFKLSNDKNLDKAKVPAIYRVVDGYDTPVNVRVEGGTIIAETMSKGWTLRSGEAHLCIRAK